MQTICPYPGLRPFNEEESIFFKGRELQVERLVKRLEEKKFLMVNGASGDGKSSLIYAGVIPFAKAGFFKAKYNNWIVADFRPERTPLKNLTKSLTKHLKLDDLEKTEKELGYGFSALCDLYKNSIFYIDETKPEWKNADDVQKKSLKRKASNLLILVDQFEEFFTNPENYLSGIPSLESQKTVNLLLETYKIAAAQDLPIYVVCTMRSDYIGQCAAFRGLPEAIGYSQFFVPRLKRQEIEQVIEGPAELAGCKISKRLTQTLLNSLTDGFDQLPILQHALNHIWKMANNGEAEMDLIHLAKVGGISPTLLALEDKENYETWFEPLPEYKKHLLEKPSLSNVLNAHATELYLSAHLYYKEKHKEEISSDEAQKIIKVVFQCLTKIDASRAVRNRMTLQEITDIINDENVSTKKVDQLLVVYREQGNTFLQPFIEADETDSPLANEQVLDITHESLIRNWTQLSEWANVEFENFQNYLDFDKQLQRWINSKYNSGYLLPIGPLSYFENWYEQLQPSKYWINRYEKFEGNEIDNLKQAEEKLNESKNFIEKSGRKLFVTKTVMKYGANKIATVFGIIFFIGIITYYYMDYRKKQNDYVLNEIMKEGINLLKDSEIPTQSKAKFLIANDRLRECRNLPLNFDSLLASTQNDSNAIYIVFEMITQLNKISLNDSLLYNKNGEYSNLVLNYTYKLYHHFVEEKLKIIGRNQAVDIELDKSILIISCGINMMYNFKNSKVVQQTCNLIVDDFKKLIYESLKQGEFDKLGINNENLLTSFISLMSIDTKMDYRKFIELISPFEFESESRTAQPFKLLFKNKGDVFTNCNKIPKGGYFEFLSILYSTEYDVNPESKRILTSLIDSTRIYNQIYVPTNITDILFKNCKNSINAVQFVNNHSDFYKWKDQNTYWNIKCKSLFDDLNKNGKCFLPQHSKIQYFISDNSINQIWEKSESILKLNKSINGKLELANFYKLWGFYYSYKLNNIPLATTYFKEAISQFKGVAAGERELEFSNVKNTNDIWTSRAFNFLHPFPMDYYEFSDFNCTWLSSTGWSGYVNVNQDSPFLTCILENNDEMLYRSNYGYKGIEIFSNPNNKLVSSQINLILNSVVKNNSLHLSNEIITNQYISNLCKLSETGKKLEVSKIDLSKIPKNIEIDEDYLIKISAKLIESGELILSEKIMNLVSKEKRTESYLNLCLSFDYDNYSEYTFYLLNELLKVKNNEKNNFAPDFYRLLGRIGGNSIENNFAKNEIREYPEFFKPFAIDSYLIGLAENGKYYKTQTSVPDYYSKAKHLELYSKIIMVEVLKVSKKQASNSYQGNWNDGPFYNYATNFESILDTKIGGKSE